LIARGTTNQLTGNFTLDLTHSYDFIIMLSGSPQTITVPENASVAFPTGTEITFVQHGAGTVTFAASGAATIYSLDSNLTIAGQYAAATLKKAATDEWYLVGALTT